MAKCTPRCQNATSGDGYCVCHPNCKCSCDNCECNLMVDETISDVNYTHPDESKWYR